jgi:hypothetical protein
VESERRWQASFHITTAATTRTPTITTRRTPA